MTDRVLLVTGASRGIGAAVARLAAQRGYRVCVNYRSSADEAAAVVADIRAAGGTGFAVQADTGNPDDVAALFAAVDREYGRLDALVNNAGIYGAHKLVEDLTAEDIRRALDVNVLGCVLCAGQAVKRMSRKNGGAGGSIVNVSSIAGQNGASSGRVLYGLTKGAVDTFTKGLAKEVAGDGILVNAVAPGLTDTAFNPPGRVAQLASSVPIQRVAEPEEIARGILWLLSDEASYCVAASLMISGGRM